MKRGVPCGVVQTRLHQWRSELRRRDFSSSLFSTSAVLKDETLDLLSSVGPILSREHLTRVLAGQWKWESRYGDDLYCILSSMDIPPMKPFPRKPRGTKRVLNNEEQQLGPSQSGNGTRKRARIATNDELESTSTAVIPDSFDFTFQVKTYIHSQFQGGPSQMYDPYSNSFA